MYRRLRHYFSLPLFRKELAERASRKRTYALRVLYGAMLMAGFFLMEVNSRRLLGMSRRHGADDPMAALMAVLGRGNEMLDAVLNLQLLGILLFLPPMMCGLINTEKERGTLPLLFLTDLSPGQIVLQKYLSGLFPMMTLALISLPLMGVAYSFGGVDEHDVTYRLQELVLMAAFTGAVALACSAIFSGAAGALVATYVFLGVFARWAMDSPHVKQHLVIGILGGLLLARWAMVRFATAPRLRLGKRLFAAMDRGFHRLNNRFGGILIGGDDDDVPEKNPVAWRERSRRSLGKMHYQLRVTVGLLIAEFFGVFWVRAGDYRSPHFPFSVGEGGLWAVAFLWLSLQASDLISSERSSQTLQPLLTTPLSGADIVRQKMAGVSRGSLVMLVPFAFILVMNLVVKDDFSATLCGSAWVYGVLYILSVAVYLFDLVWLGMFFSLRSKGRFAAMMKCWTAVVMVTFGLAVLGAVLAGNLAASGNRPQPEPLWLLYLSPGYWLFYEHQAADFLGQTIARHLLLYALIGWGLRHHCLRNADRLLGRPAPR